MKTQNKLSTFAKDVSTGLSSSPKFLHSKYIYDAQGDSLFQQIMQLPEYYLTDSEAEILNLSSEAILSKVNGGKLDIIELGAGDGSKTKTLLVNARQLGREFRYVPLDISENVLSQLKNSLNTEWPDLEVVPLSGDYFKALSEYSAPVGSTQMYMFLGSTIGNFKIGTAGEFLKKLGDKMMPGSHFLIGFDLKKNPQLILDAYNDKAGITAAFNFNLLKRINSELGGNFELSNFKHWPSYEPVTGAMRSFLVSTAEQEVHVQALGQTFHFKQWESIDVELSRKFSTADIENLAKQAGFTVVEHFYDGKGWFADSLWRKA